MIPGNPTILDVARTANLGKTTVSDVLREKSGYSDATRKRVLAAARQLGYRRDYHGSALRGGRTMSLGVLGAAPNGAASQAITRGVEIAARQRGYVTYSVGWGEEDKEKATQHVEELIHRRVDGIVYYSADKGPPSQPLKALARTNIPVVYIGWPPPNAAHVIHVDRKRAIHELARHVADLGHSHAAYVTSLYVQENPDLKLRTYEQAFELVGVSLDTSHRWMISPRTESATACYELVAQRIGEGDAPSMLLMNSDLYAVAAMAACHDAGLRVPADISVVGFDDEDIAGILRPSLTTIHQPREELGQAAFKVLEHVLRSPDDPIEPPKFACRFIPRQSTGAYAVVKENGSP